ncbi:hypothetical protein ACQRC6_07475 [Peptoniphilus sp. SGI.035]|uniref:hypothetical protein n=1 Tax=Peptoniphilus sp. SGI.035 TaxID=3420564 RepID=UPI003CFFD1ED
MALNKFNDASPKNTINTKIFGANNSTNITQTIQFLLTKNNPKIKVTADENNKKESRKYIFPCNLVKKFSSSKFIKIISTINELIIIKEIR